MCNLINQAINTMLIFIGIFLILIIIHLLYPDLGHQLAPNQLNDIYTEIQTIQEIISTRTKIDGCAFSNEIVTNIAGIFEKTLNHSVEYMFNKTTCKTEFDVTFCDVPEATINSAAEAMKFINKYFFGKTMIRFEADESICGNTGSRRMGLELGSAVGFTSGKLINTACYSNSGDNAFDDSAWEKCQQERTTCSQVCTNEWNVCVQGLTCESAESCKTKCNHVKSCKKTCRDTKDKCLETARHTHAKDGKEMNMAMVRYAFKECREEYDNCEICGHAENLDVKCLNTCQTKNAECKSDCTKALTSCVDLCPKCDQSGQTLLGSQTKFRGRVGYTVASLTQYNQELNCDNTEDVWYQ